jgi:hypothetical protein
MRRKTASDVAKRGTGQTPRGPYKGNTETLGVRLRPEIKEELQRMAESNGWSVSQIAQKALRSWIDHQRGPHGPALADAMFKVIERVKAETGESLDKPFTAAATRLAVVRLLEHIWPPPLLGDDPVPVPNRVRDRVTRETGKGGLPSEVQAFELTPEGVAWRAAIHVIERIENAASEVTPDGLHPAFLDSAGYWEIRQALGSGSRRFNKMVDEAKRRGQAKGGSK